MPALRRFRRRAKSRRPSIDAGCGHAPATEEGAMSGRATLAAALLATTPPAGSEKPAAWMEETAPDRRASTGVAMLPDARARDVALHGRVAAIPFRFRPALDGMRASPRCPAQTRLDIAQQ
jgi:hypothetical protein